MKNTLKRVGALLIAAVMMIAMCVPVMADTTPTPPADTDTAVITVVGVNSDDAATATVKAYRIVEPVYNDQGLVGFETVDGLTFADIEKPTSDEIKTAAAAIIANPSNFTSVTLTKSGDNYVSPTAGTTGAAGAGEYIVIISGTNTSVYNPAVVSIDYTNANDAATIDPGTVNIGETFDSTFGSVAYVKRTDPTLDKSIVVAGEGGATTDANGTTVSAKGDNTTTEDTINFKIKVLVPSYAMTGTTTSTTQTDGSVTTTTTYTDSTYTDPIVRISDTLDDTFNSITDLVVKDAAGNTLTAPADYTITPTTLDKTFTITLTNDYLLNHGGTEIVVTYSATLQDIDDAQNYAENANTAKYEYSNDPTDASSVKTLQDVTYNYTFAIDGLIDAEADEDDGNPGEITKTTETHELDKVTETTEVTTWTEKTGEVGESTKVSKKALEGAEFTLYTEDKFNTTTNEIAADAVGSAVQESDANGHIYFHGLNVGTYYIKETSAPDGYTINDTIYKVVITATLNEAGILTGHSIVFTIANGTNAGSEAGSITYTNTAVQDTDAEKTNAATGAVSANNDYGKVVNTVTTVINPLQVVDTPLPVLPSTGGVGSFIFTVIGVAVMVLMAASFFRSRAKKA